jgi:hypothetical protein
MTPGLDRVRFLLGRVGGEDGAFVQQVLASVLDAAPDQLRPLSALVLADAAGRPGDEPVVRFAAALHCVVAATVVHRGWFAAREDTGRDHLQVLAGDYLYAQAAVFVAQLHDLRLMSALSAAIMELSASPDQQPGSLSLAPLFHLSGVGVGILLDLSAERAHAGATYGRLLDACAARRKGPAAQRARVQAAGQAARLFALPHKVSQLDRLAALVAGVQDSHDEVVPVSIASAQHGSSE